MDQPLEGETTLLTPAQAQRLNQEDHTMVLEYEYDTPERVLQMGEVHELLQQALKKELIVKTSQLFQ